MMALSLCLQERKSMYNPNHQNPNHQNESNGPFSIVRKHLNAAELMHRYWNKHIEERGGRIWVQCPFHDDRNPSMSARPQDDSMQCWTCGKSVSAIDVLAQERGISPIDMAKEITDDIQGKSRDGQGTTATTPWRQQSVRKPQHLPRLANPELNAAAFTFAHCQIPLNFCDCQYHRQLGCTAKTQWERKTVIAGLNYMEKRGLRPELAEHIPLGIGSCSTPSLVRYLKEQGFDESTEGWDYLFFPPNEEKGWGQAFRFSNCLIIGEPGENGIDWLCGRSFKPAPKMPHVHQSGKPQDLLLGANALPQADFVALLTEGTIDYALAKQWGYHAVSLTGVSNVTESAIQRESSRVSDALANAESVVVAMDADAPGEAALQRVRALLGEKVRPLRLPPDVKDIGELGEQTNGEEIFAIAFYNSLE